MAKYHVNGAGDPGVCSATKGNCPFGGADQHYTSKEGARKAFEELVAKTPAPTIEPGAIRFQKYTSHDDIQWVTRRVASVLKLNPGSKMKVQDKHGYGLGVNVIGYDQEKGEYYHGLSYLRGVTRYSSSKNLSEVIAKVAATEGFHDDEKETVDWDE